MSAFYDIWIGNSNTELPSYKRLDNNNWEAEEFGFKTFISIPGNEEYLSKHSNAGGDIIILGQFYEKVDLNELLIKCLDINHSGSTFVEPAGHYVILVYDKQNKKYHIFTNRLGTYHLYYSSIDNRNILSTYYLGLAKSARYKNLDWEGITGFMANGFFPGSTTYLEGISILEPASHYIFDEELKLISHKRYWDWQYEPVTKNRDSMLEEFDDILKQVLEYTVKDKNIALPISGGLDSRTLAGVMTKMQPTYSNVWSYSYGFSNKSVETKIASQVAAARNLSFNSYIVPDYLFEKAGLITDSVELFQYVDGTRQASVKEQLEVNSDIIIGGHWGDVWLDDAGMSGLSEEEYFQKKIVKRGSSWLLQEICKQYYPSYNAFLKNYFSSWTHKYKEIPDRDFRMKIYKTDQWSFRWTVPSLRMYQAAVMPVLPFYDKRVVDFFTGVNSQILKDREFQVEYLKKYHPDLAKIKWQEYDSNLYNYQKYNNRQFSYRALKKITSLFSSKKSVIRNWEIFYLNDSGRVNLERVLMYNQAFNEVVPVTKVKELLNEFYDYPNAANGYKISMLHTFAQFMKTVF